MPFRSEAQRRFLFAREPEVAKRWAKHTPKSADLPDHVGKMMADNGFTLSEAKSVALSLGVDWGAVRFTAAALARGMNVELEHSSVTKRDARKTAMIALDHLRESPTYYAKLARMERGLVGKFVYGDTAPTSRVDPDQVYAYAFDRTAFPKVAYVRAWFRRPPFAGPRAAFVERTDTGWLVRQRAATGEHIRVIVAPGVAALVPVSAEVMKAFGAERVAQGASGPGSRYPEMPDFNSLYASPESQKRASSESEQGAARRLASWRDHNFGGLHGVPPEPVLRYGIGKTSTADIAITQPKHYLTVQELKQHRSRIRRGTGLGYDKLQPRKGSTET